MDGPLVSTFEAASKFLVQAVEAVPETAWDEPGLGTWSVVQLVAHANRAHTTVEDYLLRPQAPEPAGSTYFTQEEVAARGREAVRALGDDPKAAVAAASERVVALVSTTPAGATIGSPAGTMTLASYLPSRVAELTVHGLDLARACTVRLPAPPKAVAESLRWLVSQVVRRGDGEMVLLALSGRAGLPSGFSAY
jgi:uncharacterized protein (TIGR03083 family)